MKAFYYILFVAITLAAINFSSKLVPANTFSEAAEDADLLIANSRLYAKEHAYKRSLHQLDLAIETIQDIEQDLDEDSKKTIDKAVRELQFVHEEITKHQLKNTDMNHAYTKTMNALTYAELKITEHFIETDDYHEAMAALKSGMIHIENALKFVDGGHIEYELQIYAEIDSLLEHPELGKEEVVIELEKMLNELNTLVED